MRIIKAAFFPLALLLSLEAFAQNEIFIPFNSDAPTPLNIMDQALFKEKTDIKNYEIKTIESSVLMNKLKSGDLTSIEIAGISMQLYPSNIISSSYKSMHSNGEFVNMNRAVPYTGYTKKGYTAALTLAEGFISMYVNKGDEQLYLEPASHYLKNANEGEYIFYSSKDIKQSEEKTCGVTADQFVKSNLSSSYKSLVGECLDVDYPVAADFSFVNKYGGTSGAENQIIAVINNINTDYDDSFDDQLNFVLSGSFLVSVSGNDPWTSSLSANDLLSDFASWGSTYWSNVGIAKDVSSLWTNRDFTGATIGLAYRSQSAVCSSNISYNVLQDFSNSTALTRVLVSHELGHNFNAVHDGSGSNTIMAPSVNSTTTWSSTSISTINTTIPTRTCLSTCIPNGTTPTIQFGESESSLVESSTTGSEGLCNLDFVDQDIAIALSNTPSESINVTINVDNNSTATIDEDFILLNNTITFPVGSSTTKTITIRHLEDHMSESQENIILNFTVTSGAHILGSNLQHTVNIQDNDAVQNDCCSGINLLMDYQGTSAYSGGGLAFNGSFTDGRSRALFLASELIDQGLSAGPIDAMALIVTTKNTNGVFNDFRIGMTHTNLSNLNGASWIATDELYFQDYETNVGLNYFSFDTPFIWNGTSNLYIQFCYNNTASIGQDNIALTSPVESNSIHMIKIQNFDGSTNGCTVNNTSAGGNYTIPIQPRVIFYDNLGAQAETEVNSTAQGYVKAGETAHLYSSDQQVICSVDNLGSQDIECIEATVVTAGTNKLTANFGNGQYSAKTYEITGTNNGFYNITLYYTDAELATFGATNINDLKIVKSAVPLSSATEQDIEIISPSSIEDGIGGNDQYGFTGTFQGFSYFAITNVSTNALVGDLDQADLVIDNASYGLLFKNTNGTSYRLAANNSNQLTTSVSSGSPKACIPEGDLHLTGLAKGIILKKPSGSYLKLTIDTDGSLMTTPLSSLSGNRVSLADGDFEIGEQGKGLVLTNSNGACYRLSIDNAGNLSAIPLGVCP